MQGGVFNPKEGWHGPGQNEFVEQAEAIFEQQLKRLEGKRFHTEPVNCVQEQRVEQQVDPFRQR
jgi:hypothetical protein